MTSTSTAQRFTALNGSLRLFSSGRIPSSVNSSTAGGISAERNVFLNSMPRVFPALLFILWSTRSVILEMFESAKNSLACVSSRSIRTVSISSRYTNPSSDWESLRASENWTDIYGSAASISSALMTLNSLLPGIAAELLTRFPKPIASALK